MRKILLALITLSGCSAPPSPSCRNDNQACADTSDCCSAFVCTNGYCTAPSACPPAAPIDCGSILPGACCDNTHPYCCADGNCYAIKSDCGAKCFTIGQACGAGCCAGLACTGGKCAMPPPKCGPANCASGCCDGAGTCRNGTVSAACGSGGAVCDTCTINETCSAQQCQPKCASQGQACGATACCSGLGLTCYGGTCVKSEMTWRMTNSWGAAVDIEFWDQTANLFWPGNGNVWEQGPGTTDYPLACTLGHSVCYGAEDLPRNYYWGVGLNHRFFCNNCCYACDGKVHSETLQ